jgi:hypothetical protein
MSSQVEFVDLGGIWGAELALRGQCGYNAKVIQKSLYSLKKQGFQREIDSNPT